MSAHFTSTEHDSGLINFNAEEDLESLDTILEEAGSLWEFMDRRELVDRYFRIAQAYYGPDRFRRAVFDTILSQVEHLVVQYPALASRLWEKQDSFRWGFSISCGRALARDIYPSRWLKYLDTWTAQLEEIAEHRFRIDRPQEFLAYAEPVLKASCQEVEDFKKRLSESRLSPLEEKRLSRSFYKELRNRPEHRVIAAYSVRAVIWQTHIRSRLTCEDAELVLEYFRIWRECPERLVLPIIRKYSSPIQTTVRDLIPTLAQLKARSDIFPRRVAKTKSSRLAYSESIKAGKYSFSGCPRLFHGIFRGLSVHDCLSSLGFRTEVHPARWATACVPESQTIHIKSRGKYYGSVSILPVYISGQRWGLMEFWSPLLANLAVVETDGGARTEIFAHRVVSELSKRKPADWAGLCYCDDLVFDNWGVLRVFKTGPFWSFQKEIGVSDDLKIRDPLAISIADTLPRGEKASRFQPGLIYSGASDSGLRVMEPDFCFES